MQNARTMTLTLDSEPDERRVQEISRALSSLERVRILRFLQKRSSSLSEISEHTGLPFSSVARHVDVLRDAGLIFFQYRPGIKSRAKYCALSVLDIDIRLEGGSGAAEHEGLRVDMPIGLFSRCEISSPCGMLGGAGFIGEADDPGAFFSPERAGAQCLWFDHGSLGYTFPLRYMAGQPCREAEFSLELCSEAPYYNNTWSSDITFYVNGTELFTYTSPGDFGGVRGRYTPDFWPVTSTQYGLLKTFTVTDEGVFLDAAPVNRDVTLRTLRFTDGDCVELGICVKEDAEHRGGINLFGAKFGNYPQDIIFTLR